MVTAYKGRNEPSLIDLLDLMNAVRSRYSIRKASGRNAKYSSIEVALPKGAIELAARRMELSVDEFVSRYEAETYYGPFNGIFLRWVEKA